MAHPLLGCRYKLSRAERHRQDLGHEIRLWSNRDPWASRLERETEGTQHTLRSFIDVREEPPSHLGLIIGDWAHNLRSALDYLMYELVRLDHGQPLRGTQFPICRQFADYQAFRRKEDKSGKRTCFMRVLEFSHRRAINRAQPYRRRDGADTHPLAILRAISNRDKHRLLHTAVFATQPGEGTAVTPKQDVERIVSVTPCYGLVDKSAEILEVVYISHGPDPGVNVKDDIKLDIAFDNGLPVVETLREVTEYVFAVVSEFDQFVFGAHGVRRFTRLEPAPPRS